jgi:hypothetical protein
VLVKAGVPELEIEAFHECFLGLGASLMLLDGANDLFFGVLRLLHGRFSFGSV